ncbi:LicD family protein [Chitinophaga sp. 22620]|uniref:LicD family protein n=1 Tax=Chitinophaga sp. 22620 TaxID=3453952 RepID=UPI003F8724E2
MIVYKLLKDVSDKISVSVLDSEMIPVSKSLPVENMEFRDKYGIEMTDKEVELFQAHYAIWNDFKTNRDADLCIVLEEGVTLAATHGQIARQINTISDEWDILFPYDKVKNHAPVNSICLSHFGFFWGYYFYAVNKKGADKLLSFKAIRQPLDEQILTESLNKNLTIYAGDTGWFAFNETASWSYQARSASIVHFFENYNVWDKDDKTKALEMLAYIQAKAKAAGVKIGLHAGTLLGAVRHNKIMDWDDDIDLMIRQDDAGKLLEAIKNDGIYNITNWTWKKTGKTYYKIWQDGGKFTEGFEYSFPFIDIWTYEEEEKAVVTNDGYSFSREEFFPLKLITFESGDFYIPNNSRAYLDIMYKDWDKTIKIFSWSHQNKQHINTQMNIPIITDNFGRFVNYHY